MRVALVYDRLNKIGGAEKILVEFAHLYPDADWYTSVWDPTKASFSRTWHVHTSFFQNLAFLRNHHEWLLPFMPSIFESFDLSAYDLVISIGSAECKAVITLPKTLHIHYCLTPTRYLWSHQEQYLHSFQYGFAQRLLQPLGRLLTKVFQQWDYVAAQRPDYMISISEHVKKRVQKYYNRTSELIYPPVDTRKFKNFNHTIPRRMDKATGYYLVVSRLVPYKNLDLIIRACNRLKQPLIIIGEGIEQKRLKHLAGPTVQFLGFVDEPTLISYYSRCRAYIQANIEDFGIAMVEAQAAGKPVIAYNQGGAAEIVTTQTGVLYNDLSVNAIVQAIRSLQNKVFDPAACRRNATQFDRVIWYKRMTERIDELWIQQKNSG